MTQPLLVLSPHLDDAVFSLTEYMLTLAADDPITVATVFSEGNQARKDENHHALALLQLTELNLGLFDEPDRLGPPRQLVAKLRNAAAEFNQVLVPLGIRHPDHRAVTDAAVEGIASVIVGFYEELPYRVLFPDDRATRVAELRHLFPLEIDSCGGRLADKQMAVAAYPSQVGEDVERCVYAPERIWWVRP